VLARKKIPTQNDYWLVRHMTLNMPELGNDLDKPQFVISLGPRNI